MRRFLVAGATAAIVCLSTVILAAPPADGFDHSVWDRLLQTYVDERGLVAYKSLAAKDRPALDEYVERIAAADPGSMSREGALAFYINAYNALVFRCVLDGGTAESLFRRAKFFRSNKFEIAGETLNLDDLEQKVIRPKFNDARIHFALVCASGSCPQLARRAYTAENLGGMLDAQGRQFLSDRSRNPLGDGRKVVVSKIFDWYAEDFVTAAGSVQAYLAKWLGERGPACLRDESCTLDYADYDWTLNAQEGQRP